MGKIRAQKTTLDEWVLERYVTKDMSVKEFLAKIGDPGHTELARRLHLTTPQSLGFWVKRSSMPWAIYLALLAMYGEPKHHRPPRRVVGARAARLPVHFAKYVEDAEVRRKHPEGKGSVRIPTSELPAPPVELQPIQVPAEPLPPAPTIPTAVEISAPSLGVLTVRVELVTPNGVSHPDKVTEVIGPMSDKEKALLKRIKELEEQVSTLRLAATGGQPPIPTPIARIHNVARTHPELGRTLAGVGRR